jgi:hypothetical protein
LSCLLLPSLRRTEGTGVAVDVGVRVGEGATVGEAGWVEEGTAVAVLDGWELGDAVTPAVAVGAAAEGSADSVADAVTTGTVASVGTGLPTRERRASQTSRATPPSSAMMLRPAAQ